MIVEFVILLLIILYLIAVRIAYLVYQIIFKSRKQEKQRNKTDKVKCVIVIGSGGHTSEMVQLTKCLNSNRYSPRTYIMSETDKWSEQKIRETEDHFVNQGVANSCSDSYEIVKIPRSREVHQPYFTSIFSTLYSILYCVPVLLRLRPDIVLCNGPGTCIPICVVVFLMRVFFLSNNRIVFIESVCRVQTLSLSGKILSFMADEILVQWPELMEAYPQTKYIGRL